MTSDQISVVSLWVAVASALVSFIALGFSWVAIRRADRNSSASLLVVLNDGFRQAWQRFHSSKAEEDKRYELAELMNLLEIASAFYNEGSLSGVSRGLLEDYLDRCLEIIGNDDDARHKARTLFDDPKTFEHIRRFSKTRANPPRIFKR